MRALSAVVVLAVSLPVFAHRLDEYLQAATIDVGRDRVAVRMTLTPGVEVMRAVMGGIDADGDGVISEGEQRAYAERVVADLLLAVDGEAVGLRVVSAKFPEAERTREGLGEIEVELEGRVAGGGGSRRLVFENRHQRGVSAYLVNALVPSGPEIRIGAQRRNLDQSRYEVEYTDASARARGIPVAAWSTVPFWVGANAVVLGVWGVVAWRKGRPRSGNSAGKPAR